MFTLKNALKFLALVAMSEVLLIAPASAAPLRPPHNPYAAAISEAERGNSGPIDSLLAGQSSAAFQTVLREYLTDKGQLPQPSAAPSATITKGMADGRTPSKSV